MSEKFMGCTFFAMERESINALYRGKSVIPKILFQTSQEFDPNVFDYLEPFLPKDWQYLYFTDEDCLKFFDDNKLAGFDKIKEKFLSFKKGAHKADLFRYYFLYFNGGIFIDYDFMLQSNVFFNTGEIEFFSILSSVHPGTIFQGVLGCTPCHEVIRLVLALLYNTDQTELDNNYHLTCLDMYKTLQLLPSEKIRLFY